VAFSDVGISVERMHFYGVREYGKSIGEIFSPRLL
jgi:hypothetical protein